jgi:hypothetical protein
MASFLAHIIDARVNLVWFQEHPSMLSVFALIYVSTSIYVLCQESIATSKPRELWHFSQTMHGHMYHTIFFKC